MTPDRWQKIESLYHAALERSPELRPPYLAEACDSDEALRLEVEKLLAQDSEGGAILDQPAWNTFGAEAPEAQEFTGAQLGPYELKSELGRGGMGLVYLAVDTRLGRKVALKVSRNPYSRRFQSETRAIASLNHPRICTLHDIGPHYMVMELLDGETLASRIRRGKLSGGGSPELWRADRGRPRRSSLPRYRSPGLETRKRHGHTKRPQGAGFRFGAGRFNPRSCDGEPGDHGNARLHGSGAAEA